MDSLKALRSRINAVDDHLLALLQERARLALEVATEKEKLGRPLAYDPDREREVLARIQAAADPALLPAAALRAIYREIISACLALQRPLSVAWLGPEGTFSHMAALQLFGQGAHMHEAATIEGVFDAVVRGEASRGVVPIANSTEGSVAASWRGLLQSGLQVEREWVMDIQHCLLSHAATLPAVTRVYSHPQALGQCAAWLRVNLPNAAWHQTSSTASAVQEAARDPGSAALASALAGQLHGLGVLAAGVQDQRTNATRFWVVGWHDALPTGDDHTVLAFALQDGPGALRQALEAFEREGVSLTHIESHPSRERDWGYVFVAEVAGHRQDAATARALDRLQTLCPWMRLMGSFPRHRIAG
jgi:chorismate mutase/prephenate dehydratase